MSTRTMRSRVDGQLLHRRLRRGRADAGGSVRMHWPPRVVSDGLDMRAPSCSRASPAVALDGALVRLGGRSDSLEGAQRKARGPLKRTRALDAWSVAQAKWAAPSAAAITSATVARSSAPQRRQGTVSRPRTGSTRARK